MSDNESVAPTSYEKDIAHLRALLSLIGSKVSDQLSQAIQALDKQDRSIAQNIVNLNLVTQRISTRIDQHILRILALRQPVALDLHFVLASIKISYHLKRVGGYTVSIARLMVPHFDWQEESGTDVPPLLLHMCQLTQQMLNEVLMAFVQQDSHVVSRTWRDEKEVDSMYAALLRTLLTYMMENPQHINASIHFLFIVKNIERIGDHIMHIAENIYTMIYGANPVGDEDVK